MFQIKKYDNYSGSRLESDEDCIQPGGKDIEAWQLARELTRKVLRLTKKDYISQRSQSFKKIRHFFSVFPVCSVRETYSAMHHIMKKNANRLTVKREP